MRSHAVEAPTNPPHPPQKRTEVGVEEEAQGGRDERPKFVGDQHHEQAVGQHGHGARELVRLVCWAGWSVGGWVRLKLGVVRAARRRPLISQHPLPP